MKTNFILHIGIFAILTTMPNIAKALEIISPTHCIATGIGTPGCICLGGTNDGATCSVDSQCPGGICINDESGGIDIGKCTSETCKPTTTGWGSCGFGANSYVECEATAECVGSLCARQKLPLCCRRIRQPQRIKQNRLCTMSITRNIGRGFDQSIRLLYSGRNHRFGQYWHV